MRLSDIRDNLARVLESRFLSVKHGNSPRHWMALGKYLTPSFLGPPYLQKQHDGAFLPCIPTGQLSEHVWQDTWGMHSTCTSPGLLWREFSMGLCPSVLVPTEGLPAFVRDFVQDPLSEDVCRANSLGRQRQWLSPEQRAGLFTAQQRKGKVSLGGNA